MAEIKKAAIEAKRRGKNVKNELRFINSAQKTQSGKGFVMSREYRFQIMKLFETKKNLIKELLLLKSAFSVIDQIFVQEIKKSISI